MRPVGIGEDDSEARVTRQRSFRDLDAAEVQRQLGLARDTVKWLGRIERPPDSPGPRLPGAAEAAQALERLGVTAVDRVDTLAARPDPIAHPALWWMLDRLYHDVLADLGRPVSASGFPGWPAFPASVGPPGRHLYVWLYLALLPFVRQYHLKLAVPDDISWAGLGNVGDQMAKDRAMYGVSGLGAQWMLPLIFRGGFYSGLGRLDYDREFSPVDFASATDSKLVVRPPRRDEPVVNVHIPGNGQPLHPSACDASIARAGAFFTRTFSERPAAFICHSWILDEQLAAYLPATSNLIRFQQRFRLTPDTTERADRFMLRLIFRRDPQDWAVLPAEVLDQLPQDTTLQCAFVTHLRAGHHWINRTGWFPL